MSTSIANYRPDIDGLRAVAVLSVLLFHAFPQALPGGFVGVDIFFVISGYLISSILVKETQQNRFSVLQFYVRRARRIFPALLVVLLSTLVLGWLCLFPGEWRALGKHVAAGAAFISNLALWQESGYFDSSSDLKPLLHLWSLAVEEQFYLLWPLAIFLVGSRSLKGLAWLTTGLFILSLSASAVLTPRNATLAFYIPFTRFWELLIGGGLAIWQANPSTLLMHIQTKFSALMSLLGMAGLVLSTTFFHPSMAFPGYAAALPVISSAMLIASGPKAMANRWILSNRIAITIGLISYPLYLWHWPLLVMSRLWTEGQDVQPVVSGSMLVLAWVLAWLTYRFIETPLRDSGRNALANRDARHLWIGLLILGAIGVAAWKHLIPAHSEQSRLVQKIDQAEADWEPIGDQTWKGGKAGTVLFVGDSHMEHYAPRIAEIMHTQASRAHTVQLMALSGCAPVPGINRISVDCASFTDKAFNAMQSPEVVTVVLSASWKGFSIRPDYYKVGDATHQIIHPLADSSQWVLDNWRDHIRRLVQSGKRVVVLLSSPRGDLVEPKHFVHRSLWLWEEIANGQRPYDELKRVVREVDTRIAQAASQAGAEVVDPFKDFCHGSTCAVSTPDGEPIFMDDSHIRSSYAHHHVHILDPYFFLD